MQQSKITPRHRGILIACLFACLAVAPLAAQIAWTQRIAARTNATAIWGVYDRHRDRVLSLDKLANGLQLTEVNVVRRRVGAGALDARLARGVVGFDFMRRLLLVVVAEANGAELTFAWNGSTWTQHDRRGANATRVAIGGRLFAHKNTGQVSRLVADVPKNRVDVEDYVGTSWRRRAVQGGPSFTRHVSVASAPFDRVLVFDGTRGETWLLRNNAWTKQGGASPSPRIAAAMEYDAARDRFVLHGGLTESNGSFVTLSDTWDWNGSWSRRLASTSSADRRHGHSLVYTPQIQRTLAIGGAVTSGSTSRPRRAPRDDVRDLAATNPALWSRFGNPCGLSSPRLSSTAPWLGDTLQLRLFTRSFGTRGGLFLTGFSRSAWGRLRLPLNLSFIGTPTCALHVRPDLINALGNSQLGVAYPLPNARALVGQRLFHQIAIDDLGRLDWSNGVELRIGAR